ncbi:MAG TPA: STAS domain-containing protein [Chloroflexota bacterium]|nr:STAS domain-containing protein [Chloroflexota bacterium]
MPNEIFDLSMRRLPDLAILDLAGEINAAAETKLSAGYDQAEAAGTPTVLLNFKDVDYINSTGIALIVSLLGRARAGGKRLLACGLSDHYVEIFNITRLADFMSVFPDESTAIAESPAVSTKTQ